MSISTEITRLQGLRNTLRTKLVSMLGVSSSADLEDCITAVDGITENGAVTGTISAKAGQYTIPAGYHNGSGIVEIASAERAKIIAGNIKSGVSILGVAGSYAGENINLQEKSVTPTESTQTIVPDSGYDGLSAVNVGAIPSNYADVTGVTAIAADTLANKIIVDSTGAEIAGTMANNGAVTATIDGLSGTSYTIPVGYHNGSGTVSLTNAIETALAAI